MTPHGDNHDLWIAPNNNARMIEGNDGGANVSINSRQDWTDQDYSTAQNYRIATTDDDAYLVCGEQQDRGATCVSSTGGDDFVRRQRERADRRRSARLERVLRGQLLRPVHRQPHALDRSGKTGIGGRASTRGRTTRWATRPGT
jgi:hypothetical protein